MTAPLVPPLGPPPGAPIGHVLLVDDEAPVRQALATILLFRGYACQQVGSAQAALAVLAAQPVDLVLSDIGMAGMDGVQLLHALRERHPDTPVIMVSANTELQVAVRTLTMGASDYLPKPVDPDELLIRVARAIERQRLLVAHRSYHETLKVQVREQADRLEQLFLTSVQSLADALELKDPYTRGHSIRVSRYARAIAEVLRLPDATVAQVLLGGHLHDLGKIGVRESVLLKPGRLIDQEFEHIKLHPLLGHRILAPLLQDAPLALNMVRWHHERLDGSGWPDGVGGDALPLEARICAVADAFDAMLSPRPYRPNVRTVEEAMGELHTYRGTQFDPDVVAALEEALATGLVDRPTPRLAFRSPQHLEDTLGGTDTPPSVAAIAEPGSPAA